MPPLPGFVILRDGAKYQSPGIVLSLSTSPWSFGLPRQPLAKGPWRARRGAGCLSRRSLKA